MKVLSVIIPSYNTELYIRRCLDSLLYNEEINNLLDIIIVNDGSTDETASIAEEYKKAFPTCVRVINKVNGGHGSTINEGLKVAKGKYVKVIDSDDWVNIDDFKSFVEKLQKEEADIVVTNYVQVVLPLDKVKPFVFWTNDEDKVLDIASSVKYVDNENFFFQFSMHSISIKTAKLRTVWGDGLLEKTFYVDQQYVSKCLLCADTYALYNLDIYRYFIGRPEQSIGNSNMFIHRKEHERVLKELMSVYDKTENEEKKKIFKKQISLMLDTHYLIYFLQDGDPNGSLLELIDFDNKIKEKHPEFYKKSRLRRKALVKMKATIASKRKGNK